MIAAMILNKFNRKYGKYWQCFVEDKKAKYAGSNISYKYKHYIVADVYNYRITVFKSLENHYCWKCGDGVCDGYNCKLLEAKIVEENPDRTKDSAMIEDAKQVTMKAIKEKHSCREAAMLY